MDRGRVRVFLDDKEVPGSPFDLAAPDVRYGQVVVARHVTGAGPHTIRIQPAGSHSSACSGDRVDVDGILTLAEAPTP
jgi:hypothetical protein